MKTTHNLFLTALTILTFYQASSASAAGPLVDIWTWRNPSPTANQLNGITYGDGMFVAVGEDSTILTSVDGINWAQDVAPSNTTLSGVAYNSNSSPKFVAVGTDAYTGATNVILTSPDGVSWSAVSEDLSTNGLLAVAYGGGTFVAVGKGGANWHSSDGVHWTQGANAGTAATQLNGISYGMVGGVPSFVAVGSSGYIGTSANGTSWTTQSSDISSDLYGIVYNGAEFVAVGNPGCVSSSDGMTWVAASSPATSFYGNSVAYGDGTFVAVGAEADAVMTSPDGSAWTTYPGPWNFYGVAHGGGIFAGVGGGFDTSIVDYSSTGTNWTQTSTNVTSASLRALVYGTNTSGSPLFVAGGGGFPGFFPAIITSLDGLNWQVDTDPSINPTNFNSPLYNAFIDGLAYGKTAAGTNMFVASVNAESGYMGFTSYIYTSPDGIIWTSNYGFGAQGSGEGLSSIAYGSVKGSPMFVATGGSFEIGVSVSSSDLVHWTVNSANPSMTNGFNAVTYGTPAAGPRFVAVGDEGAVAFSSDGVNWTVGKDTYPTNTFEGVAFGNGEFVAVGGGVIYTSPDGQNWSLDTTFMPSFLEPYEQLYLNSVAFADGLFVAVSSEGGSPYDNGYAGSIFASADGIHWAQTCPPTSSTLYGVGSGDGQFIALGENGVILASVLPTAGNIVKTGPGAVTFDVCGSPGTFGVYFSSNLLDWSFVQDVSFTSIAPCQPITVSTSEQTGFYALGAP